MDRDSIEDARLDLGRAGELTAAGQARFPDRRAGNRRSTLGARQLRGAGA